MFLPPPHDIPHHPVFPPCVVQTYQATAPTGTYSVPINNYSGVAVDVLWNNVKIMEIAPNTTGTVTIDPAVDGTLFMSPARRDTAADIHNGIATDDNKTGRLQKIDVYLGDVVWTFTN